VLGSGFNPEGVASRSPGLPSTATLGNRGLEYQPRRGCVRVSLADLVVCIGDATPSGLRSIGVTKPRVAADGNPGLHDATPSGLRSIGVTKPRVAADGNPGLHDATPSGLVLRTQHSELSTQHSALRTQHSALSTQNPALSTQHPALSTQNSAPSTQHSELSEASNEVSAAVPRRRSASRRAYKK